MGLKKFIQNFKKKKKTRKAQWGTNLRNTTVKENKKNHYNLNAKNINVIRC